MSFKVNSSQQISFNDSVFSLTAREKKALDNSWAKIFADEIFPNIDEERFSVLYSSKASRPNAPVNVIIGALIIKELFDYSDDEIVENLMLDLHLQYALHTTSFEEQPISDKTLSRFRSRCYNYETTHGIDLYHDCVKDLSSKIAKLMNLSGRIKRMDSMMIESNIRFLSRMELIYTCISKLAIYFDKNYPNKIPDDLKHYTDSNDYVVMMLGLEDKLNNMPNNLSGGQQQRVAIARALITKPAIVLADEPTGNLDSKTSSDVIGLLKRTSVEFHQTIVMITHNDDIARLADRIIRIEDGKITGGMEL